MQKQIHKLTGTIGFQYVSIAVFAVCYSRVCTIFVFPNHFAPAGIMGISTIIQYLFHFSVGYMSLLINIPMLIVAFFIVNRQFAFKTGLFVIVSSVSFVLLGRMDLSEITYVAEGVGGQILAAIAAGFFNGLLYSLSVRAGGSTGGTDIVAAFINRKKPEFDMVWIIFTLNAVVAASSFFVYDLKYEPVILCVIYIFVNTRISETIFKGARSAAKFEVVTDYPEEIAQELLAALKHGCTVIPGRGMYTHSDKSILFCVINRRQIVEFERIISKYDNTFAYISTVNGIFGKFRHVK